MRKTLCPLTFSLVALVAALPASTQRVNAQSNSSHCDYLVEVQERCFSEATPGQAGETSDLGTPRSPLSDSVPAPSQRITDSAASDASNFSNAGNAASGGFGNLNLISGSSPGNSFAARTAPGTYIDNAIVTNMFRYRFDAAYNNPFPDRAEFFYAQCGCFGPGAPGPLLPETNVDYQEMTPYFERAFSNRFSLFAETPVRFINPEINDNTAGFGDMNFGFKRSLYACQQTYLTAQFRVYVPTGDADRGLGTAQVSFEPSLLYLRRVNDRVVTQGEFRVWIPTSDNQATVGGQQRNFAGTVLRTGYGLGYDLLKLDTCCQRRRLTGTFEAVGWYITDGLALDGSNPAAGAFSVAEDTIVNLKSGLRYTAGPQSIASSYGFAVTGDRWYSDILRLEYRYVF